MATDAGVKNIEQLRQFGRNLATASGNLTNLFGKLNMQMHAVLDSWNDESSQKFRVDFERRCKEIQQISAEMLRYSQYVAKKSERADEYKSTRY